MAEGEGFEPPIPCGTPVFKTGAFNRSATPPEGLLFYLNDPLEPSHVRAERGRHRDRPVGFLVILEHSDQRAAHGEPRAVQRVAVLRLAAGRGAVLEIEPARLER